MRDFVVSLFCAAALLAATVHSDEIRWYCGQSSDNRDSSGSAMDAGFEFELGVFDAGFTPTIANRHEWLTHWKPADDTPYDPGNGWFTGVFAVTHNDDPFAAGVEGWIFGRKDSVTGDEWILFRHEDWKWPQAPFLPSNEFTNWNVADADTVLAGKVDGDGSPFLMKSEQIRSYAQWQAAELVGEAQNEAADDPDLDGAANVIEFFCGSDPQSGASSPVPTVDFAGPGGPFLRATYARDPGSLAVATVEASGGLSSWDSAGVTLVVTGETLVATDFVPIGSAGRRFLRLRVELP